MAWLWAIPAVILVVGGGALAFSARQLAEETAALARAGQSWQALQPSVDDVVAEVGRLRRGVRALGDGPAPPGIDGGHP